MSETVSLKKIARLLKCDQDYLSRLDNRLSSVSGRSQVLDSLVAGQQEAFYKFSKSLNLSLSSSAKDFFSALLKRVSTDDELLAASLGNPDVNTPAGSAKLVDAVISVLPPPVGFFIKPEKARELLEANPPQRVLEYLGVSSVSAAIKKAGDVFSLFPALRFLENPDWLNRVFFQKYKDLTPDDFEEREIKILPLSSSWRAGSANFVRKKWHNLSHLKELGILFLLPVAPTGAGVSVRTLGLMFHYLQEISFYSGIFKDIAQNPETFSANLTSLLRGDVVDVLPPESSSRENLLVIQRYLAKDDPYDWRLFYPHLNTESILWQQAYQHLNNLSRHLSESENRLSVWENSNWIGEYLKSDSGPDILVSFDLLDNAMSLVKKNEGLKYSYHQHEALWNKIFAAYFSESELVSVARGHLLQGWVEI